MKKIKSPRFIMRTFFVYLDMIFSDTDGMLKKIDFFSIDKERTLQRLVEKNLLEVLDINFLESELITTSGGRIDTLAIDNSGPLLLLNIIFVVWLTLIK